MSATHAIRRAVSWQERYRDFVTRVQSAHDRAVIDVAFQAEDMDFSGEEEREEDDDDDEVLEEEEEEEEEEVENEVEGREEEEEGEDTNAEQSVRSDLRILFTKIKYQLPYIVLLLICFLKSYFVILCACAALTVWHVKTTEELVREIAKRESGFDKRVISKILLRSIFATYAFCEYCPSRLDKGESKMWRRVSLMKPTADKIDFVDCALEAVAINLCLRFVFDALKASCVLMTNVNFFNIPIITSFMKKAKTVSLEFMRDLNKNLLPMSLTKMFVAGKMMKTKEKKDEEYANVDIDIESANNNNNNNNNNNDNDALESSQSNISFAILSGGGKDERRPYRMRGLTISAIEYFACIIKALAPVPIWFAYFQDVNTFGLYTSSLLAGTYLACALFKCTKTLVDFKQAFQRRLNFGSKAFSCAHGVPATRGDIERLGENYECAICQSSKIIAPLKVEPCNHVFCEECVEPWFEKDNTTCPLCRAVVVEKKKESTTVTVKSGGQTQFFPVVF